MCDYNNIPGARKKLEVDVNVGRNVRHGPGRDGEPSHRNAKPDTRCRFWQSLLLGRSFCRKQRLSWELDKSQGDVIDSGCQAFASPRTDRNRLIHLGHGRKRMPGILVRTWAINVCEVFCFGLLSFSGAIIVYVLIRNFIFLIYLLHGFAHAPDSSGLQLSFLPRDSSLPDYSFFLWSLQIFLPQFPLMHPQSCSQLPGNLLGPAHGHLAPSL